MGGFTQERPVSRQLPKMPLQRIASVSVLVLLILYLLNSISSVHSAIPTRLTFSHGSSRDPLLQDVVNNTLGFQSIYCLGLPSRTDHRDAIELSAAATKLSVDWVDGVVDVEDKALPGGIGATLGKQAVGSWRAHMNALQMVVKENASSALILEDDADWDVRIKQQMHDLALSSRALTQPLSSGSGSYADPTYPVVRNPDAVLPPMILGQLPVTDTPQHSPYGDDWDVLWLGHCGVQRPEAGNEPSESTTAKTLSRGHVIHLDDETVPEPWHYRDFHGRHAASHNPNINFPNHTRAVHHPLDGFCSVAYAVSQRGARKMLWYMAVRAFDGWFDTMLPHFCEGKDTGEMGKPTCLTVQPALFDQHVPHGERWKESDIFPAGEGSREVAETPNIRWSTRINLPKLLAGNTNYTDQWPDTG